MTGSTSNKPEPNGFDVVLMHGATDDGAGARVLRARPGRLEAGEMRPIQNGATLAPGGDVVRLSPRSESPALFDVHVECTVPAETADASKGAGADHSGPAQVATSAYRESWDRTFRRPGDGVPARLLN